MVRCTFVAEAEQQISFKKSESSVGVDVGIRNLVALSSGELIPKSKVSETLCEDNQTTSTTVVSKENGFGAQCKSQASTGKNVEESEETER